MRFAHSRRCSATARYKSCRGRSKMAGTGTVSVTPTEAPKTVTESARISGGNLVAKALKNEGVEVIFTLCGGHIIDIYDGCLNEDIKIVDVRHDRRRERLPRRKRDASDRWPRPTHPASDGLAAGPASRRHDAANHQVRRDRPQHRPRRRHGDHGFSRMLQRRSGSVVPRNTA